MVNIMQDLLDQGCHVVTDNWYTIVRLGEYLLTLSTMVTGTIRSDQGPPKKIVAEKLSKHSSVFARRNYSLLVKFQDKKEVLVLTAMYGEGMVEKTKTYFGDKTSFFSRPLHIDKYNSLMGNVDMADQLLEPSEYGKKSLVWFKKIGIHFICRHPLNAFIAYRQVHPTRGVFFSLLWMSRNSGYMKIVMLPLP